MQSMIGEPRPSRSYRPRPDRPLVLEARDRPCRLWTLLEGRSSSQGRARRSASLGSTIHAYDTTAGCHARSGEAGLGGRIEGQRSHPNAPSSAKAWEEEKASGRCGAAQTGRNGSLALRPKLHGLRQRFMGHQNWHAPEECATLRSLSKNRGGGNSRTCPCTLHTTLRSFCDRGAVVCHHRG
jgi:hypothetical protein